MGKVKKFYATDYETDYANGKRGQVLVVKASDYATLEAENAKLRAELERQVPDGWKLVPVEPTSEMISAAVRCYGNENTSCWQAMLAAAPSAPKADDPVKVQLLEALEEIADCLENDAVEMRRIAAYAIAAARKGEGE